MASLGTVIDGKYEIIAEIGKGGMSTVYLAIDRRLNKQWAVKEAKKKPGKDSEIFELTPIAEANLLKSLDHPNIVRIVDIIEQGGYIYIVEDFVEGKSLSNEVKKGPSNAEDVVKWGSQLCDVFDYIHSRKPPIIYRDMKPANVQLNPDRETVKLLDFGIAKTYKAQNTSDTTNLGTRGYAAPEQFDPNRQSDPRTDIYSLGVTLRSLLMGKTPYEAEFYDDIRKQNPNVTDGLIKVINKATEQNPEKRYQTAKEFKFALQHYHDKDEAVIRLRKRSINSFRSILVSCVALILVGIMLFPISNVISAKDYDEALKNNRYTDCVEIDSGRSDVYYMVLRQKSGNTDIKCKTYNYHNIRNEDEKKAICLEAILRDFRYKSKIKNNYNEDLASNFGEYEDVQRMKSNPNVTLYYGNNENTASAENNSNIKIQLDEGDLYTSIGRIMLYFASFQDEKNEENDKNASFDFENLLNNITTINNFIKDNLKELNSDEFDKIFADSIKSNTITTNLSEFLFEVECSCFSSKSAKKLMALNEKQIEDLRKTINDNRDFGQKIDEKSLKVN